MTASSAVPRQGAAPLLTAVEKAMVVLVELAESTSPQSLAELTKRTGLAKATVHRLLAILLAYRMVERIGGHYVPGGYLAGRLGIRDAFTLLRRESTPYLMELHRETGHTAALGVLVANTVYHVNQVYGHSSPRFPERTDGRDRVLPRDAIAQVLLAHRTGTLAFAELAEIRCTGCACTEAPARGSRTVAVPVRAAAGPQLPVALGLSGRADGFDVAVTQKLLRRSAFEISRAIRPAVSTLAGPHELTAGAPVLRFS